MQLLWVSVKDFIEELEGAVCFFLFLKSKQHQILYSFNNSSER